MAKSNLLKYNKLSGGTNREQSVRVQKIPLNAGFSCPNRDGAKNSGGCVFCSNEAFIPFYAREQKTVENQLATGKKFYEAKYKCHRFVAYFQAYSNTYAPFEKLMEIYNSVLRDPEIEGLVIGTRPDCIDENILSFLEETASRKSVTIEYGVETFNDEVLKKINRGHPAQDSVDAIIKTSGRGIKICAHMILGLPGQSRQDILQDAEILSRLPVDSLKLHHLQILKNTRLEQIFIKNPGYVKLFTPEEYVTIVADFLEKLNPEIAIERFINEVPSKYLIAPTWGGIRSADFEKMLNREMINRGTSQGSGL